MTHELMQQIISIWGKQEPTEQYRLVPNDGWYPLSDKPVSYPRIPEADLEPYARYCSVQEDGRIIWRLYRDTVRRQYLLSRMEIDAGTDTIVCAFWVVPNDELAALALDFICIHDSHA
jgi:hypothetical protein